ncbi:MAG: hypothetical protein Ct9H300mP21_00050 [Pseudomonadota bacterium]|nr:MAG: hypothetical protein Ct9H300mP21_00050 [Pseudomonadota bacterium]
MNLQLLNFLSHLKIKRRVIVAVNGDEEKGNLNMFPFEGDEVLVFTVISGG